MQQTTQKFLDRWLTGCIKVIKISHPNDRERFHKFIIQSFKNSDILNYDEFDKYVITNKEKYKKKFEVEVNTEVLYEYYEHGISLLRLGDCYDSSQDDFDE